MSDQITYIKELEDRIVFLEDQLEKINGLDLPTVLEKIESELWQKNPYQTRGDGTCPGCGTWAPKGHLEAHDHKEDCSMMKAVERWKNLDQRIYDRICDLRAKWSKYRDVY